MVMEQEPHLLEYDSESTARTPWRFLAGTIVAAVAIVFVAMSAFDKEVYFLTVSEHAARAAEIGTQEFRIKGNVVEGSHYMREGTLSEHMFTLEDGGHEIQVFFAGALPDTFADEAEVVALGSMRDDGVFEAVDVVAKCPSRYEEQVPTASAAAQSPTR